jgi:hypothetical protein
MSQWETDASNTIVRKYTSHAWSQLIASANNVIITLQLLSAQNHFKGSKRLKSLVLCLDFVMDAAALLSTLLKPLSGHPDCVGYHSVKKVDDTKVWTSWFLFSNRFSQSVQCIAIIISLDCPTSGEQSHQRNVSDIPKNKGYNFSRLLNFCLRGETVFPHQGVCVWWDTIQRKV